MSKPVALVSDGRDGNTRDAVVAIRALAAGGYEVAATVTSGRWTAARSRYVDQRIQLRADNSGDLSSGLGELLDSGRFVGLIPASERVSQAVFSQKDHLLDKSELERSAVQAGLKVVSGTVFESSAAFEASAADFDYPVVAKPQMRSFKAVVVSGPEVIGTSIPDGVAILVQPYLEGVAEVISGVMWEGGVHSAIQERWVRMWPRDCGLAAYADSVVVDEARVDGLGRLMDGYQGIFSAQFVDGKLIDLNLKAYSTIPLAVAAGVNTPSIYLDLLRGVSVPETRGVPGQLLRWISGDLKGFVHDLKTGTGSWRSVAAGLRPVRGTVHSMYSTKDPLPFFLRLGSYV
jgi:predicted ATP-grasp superfamily ATP-dependent carboligase